MNAAHDVSALRQMLAGLEAVHLPGASSSFSLGAAGPDSVLAGTLARGVLHEVYAAEGADIPAACGFALALALRASHAQGEARPIVWIRQDFLESEAGRLDAHGLSGFGLDPARLILVRTHDPEQALRAAGDAVRCPALGAVLLEPWGEPKVLDLTATRRLALRSGVSGVTLFLIRVAARPSPSVAATRWRVRPAISIPLAADAPGAPAFAAELLRHRGGLQGHAWSLEWNHDNRSFRDIAPLSRAVVPVPAGQPARPGAAAHGPAPADVRPLQRAG
ncbi:ImuA family protein [Ancylobacter terrae]|uniref:ImuA family protein n=1 Tax=Ancylobacter sp. sgz301288 TaxID=3342077 RepID=UPI00385BF8DC